MKIAVGVLLLIVAGAFGMLAMGEFANYVSIADYSLADYKLNSALYLGGVSATALLSGIGFLTLPGRPRATPLPAQQP
jgi:hypothetical protein